MADDLTRAERAELKGHKPWLLNSKGGLMGVSDPPMWSDGDINYGYVQYGIRGFSVEYGTDRKAVVHIFNHKATHVDCLEGLTPEQIRRQKKRMLKAGLVEVPNTEMACSPSQKRKFEQDKARVMEKLEGYSKEVREAIEEVRLKWRENGWDDPPFKTWATIKRGIQPQTYLHEQLPDGRHVISIPEIGLKYLPCRSKRATARIKELEADGLQRHFDSVPMEKLNPKQK